MTAPWREYQNSAASFFRGLGFRAEIEAQINGARGVHEIDVFVTGVVQGIPFCWVVECKHWKSNIPKEKVLALIAIVQDVGADRGFLLSETGFQSGAIRASRATNVTLSSLEDLKFEADGKLKQDAATHLLGRREQLKTRLMRLHNATSRQRKALGEPWGKFITPLTKMLILEIALEAGIAGSFPVVYGETPDGDLQTADNWEELISRLTELVDSAEQFAAENEAKSAK